MAALMFLMLIPLLVPVGGKILYGREITWLELLFNIIIVALLMAGGWFAGRYSEMSDTQIINGQVTNKSSRQVSCEHSYTCNCRESCSRSSDGSQSCTTTCDTCYEHSYDVDWLVHGNIGDVKISRVDRRGLGEPSRWTSAVIGEPMAKAETYTNYVKASQHSLFNTLSEVDAAKKYANKIPGYPSGVHDYYRINRLITQGVAIPNASEWNKSISERLRTLGPLKQVNLVVVATNEESADYGAALRASWLNAKKNDVVVVVGVPIYPEISWVEVLAWTDNSLFKVVLRDKLKDLGSIDDLNAFLDKVQESIQRDYMRKPMSDYDYLASEVEPPLWIIVLLICLGVFASLGLTYWTGNN